MQRPDLEELDTPCVTVNQPIMRQNLERMAAICRDGAVQLRPHTKTHKSPALAKEQLQLGAVGITVAKLGEAEVMAAHGIRDILIAYELIGPHKMRRLARFLQQYPDVELKLAADSLRGATDLSNAAVSMGRTLDLLIEVDSGGGRAGVRTAEDTVSLARHIRLFPGLRLVGILTHEGQVYKTESLQEAARAAAEKMTQIRDALQAIGLECPVVSMGSTPAARELAHTPGVTELRPGTYIFNDRTQVALGAATEADCALTVLATVVSVDPGRAAFLDAGSKSLTSDAVGAFQSYGAIVADPDARLYACSEEHGHLDISQSARRYVVGDRVHILPNHVCPVVNLADCLFAYSGDSVSQEWDVAARGCVR